MWVSQDSRKIDNSKSKQVRLASFCTAKGSIKRNEKTTDGLGEIFENDAVDKDFISKLYKQLIQHNNKKTKQLNKKMCSSK